jgi:hypothetical protein
MSASAVLQPLKGYKAKIQEEKQGEKAKPHAAEPGISDIR